MYTVLFSVLFLSVGAIGGWLFCERYTAHLAFVEHDFEHLFEENPHPEIYDKDGKVYRGDYLVVGFDLGFDPEEFNPETDIRLDEDYE